MLGKLSRWLRILGHDVQYFKSASDKNLIEWATSKNRILLTKDQKLVQQAKKRGIIVFFVDGTDIVTMLSNLFIHFNLVLEINFSISRCPKCNERLISVSKDSIINEIPELTSIYYNEYWKCTKCGQIYWLGSHWKKIIKTLNDVKRNLENK